MELILLDLLLVMMVYFRRLQWENKAVSQDGSNVSGQETIYITSAVDITSFEKTITKIFPNPTKSSVVVQSSKDIEQISLYTVDGKKMVVNEKHTNSLNLQKLKNGSYMIKLNYTDQTSEVQVLLKQ